MKRALLTSPAARSRAVSLVAFAAYLVLAAVQAWPLPLHLASAFTGEPRGDTGVYIWNMWVFRHELLEGGTPFRTLEILSLGGPTDLSLHNYTVFADILALPFLSWLGVARTFNLIYLLNVALAGFGAYLLIRRITQRPVESFIGGLLFMWSPFLVTRAMGHFSLVAAAPLPIFVLALYRAWETQRLRDAMLVGLVVVWAAFCDPYYAVYCLMIGGCFYGNRLWQISVVRRPITELRAAKHVLTVAIVALAALVAVIHFGGGGRLRLGAIRISMRTLYTPMLVLTVLVGDPGVACDVHRDPANSVAVPPVADAVGHGRGRDGGGADEPGAHCAQQPDGQGRNGGHAGHVAVQRAGCGSVVVSGAEPESSTRARGARRVGRQRIR